MKNKNLIYVAIGLGAGVFAYYYFCRKKYRLNGVAGNITEGDELSSESASEDGKPISGSYNPTGTTNPVRTPILATGTTSPVISTGTTSPVITTDATSVDKPALTTDVITKENAIAPTRTLATDIKTTEPIKSGFDGMGQLCFEVGECLYDL